MKLKEKLAEELLDENEDSLLSAFLKGFETAKAMVKDRYRVGSAAYKNIDKLGESEEPPVHPWTQVLRDDDAK